ncbi:MaoC family dehydratase [Pacificimonas sp. WHA3]|uniref:MaoC family dehydratase n=1 Tax=Pacificimonas pallii TaxID=2827236 RepID=A0ABS6SE49_9SPHN|nr:MaoC family dehydratase [Pacificimonas pallii]MBV7256693.1 MaoC family dehydratase [Pacificimonas pallii]
MARKTLTKEEFLAMTGQEIGRSDWMEITQERINQFADATNDHQFIHVDPEAAAKTPFGQTIAHGFLTLSLIAGMGFECLPGVEGAKMGVNYGANKIRFMTPVKSGKRVRGIFKVQEIKERGRGILQMIYDVTVEIEDEKRPALKAEWISLTYV